MREGSLDAPIRHALDWQNPWFWDEKALEKEMERTFDICHGCRRCFNSRLLPAAVRPDRQRPDRRTRRCGKEDYAQVEEACTLWTCAS
jgi:glycerol-3-phosphate dehydrogenase subunit C